MQKAKKKTAVKSSKKTPAKKAAKPTKSKSASKSKKSSLFKFRRYKKVEGGSTKKAKHPKLIVDEKKDNLGFMGLTEAPKRGHHKNIELSKNPQNEKTNKAYLRDEVRYDNKKNFGEILESYQLSNEDKIAVIAYLKKRKKKK